MAGVGARGRCYCDDCQAYARHLAADVLDVHGGTEVIQSWPAQVSVHGGREQLRLLRLSPKGLHRWYAGCCDAPLANTMGAAGLPFVGVFRLALDVPDATLDALYGPAHGVQGRFAPGGCPPDVHPSASLGIILGALGLLARGWWRGAHVPSPFFGADGRPIVAARVLTSEERAALRT